MFVREIAKNNGNVQIVVVESVRVKGSVKQKRIKSFGTHKDPEIIKQVKATAEAAIPFLMNERKPLLPGLDPKEHYQTKKKTPAVSDDLVSIQAIQEKARISHGVKDVFGEVYRQLTLDTLVSGTRKDEQWNEVLKACVLERVRDPRSKLKTACDAEELINQSLPVEKIYRMMDKLHPLEQIVKDKMLSATLDLFQQQLDVMFFDVTTLYFESHREDDLRKFGFSKDCKFKETQVVLALITTERGLPVTYELFPGNTSEGKTLVALVEKLKNQFQSRRIRFIADRAMFTKENLKKLEDLSVDFVVACKLKSLSKQHKENILSSNNRCFQGDDYHKEIEIDNRRLIVSYSKTRASKDKKDRERLIERLKKMVPKVAENKIPLTDLIKNRGTKKYLKITKAGSAEIDDDKLSQEERWDGLHGVITNIKTVEAKEILSQYRQLWQIEEAFRINKNDLKMRPIYHWKPSRIKAHILICYMAYSLSVHLRDQLRAKDIDLSIRKIREILGKVQTSVIWDRKSKKTFCIPSKASDLQVKIYQAVGLTLQQSAQLN